MPGSTSCATRQLEDGGLKRMIYLHVVPTIGVVLTVNLQYPEKPGHVGIRGAHELRNENLAGVL